MAIYKSDIVDINLETGSIHRSFLNHTIGSGDNSANRFGVRTFRDGVPADLSGASCQAVFMNAAGVNISLTSYGTVSGNEAYVTLPQACYNVEGQFCLAIKLVQSGVTVTTRIVDGVVSNTGTTGSVAPTSSVPTYQEILSTYDAMTAATAAANTAIAEEFDASENYPAGKNVINDGALYILPNGHTAGTTWANTTKVASNLGDQVTDLKSAINILLGAEVLNFEKGYYNTVLVDETFTPAISTSDNYYCTHKACSAGDVFNINVYGGGNASGGARAYIFVDSNNVCLQVSDASAEYDTAITAPENSAHVYINNYISIKPSYYAVYGNVPKKQISDLITAVSLLDTRVDNVENETDFDLLKGATWENGAWTSFSTYPPTPTESKPTRVRTNITLAKPLYLIDIAPNDSNYNYEYTAFTEEGANVSYKNSWQSGKIVITSNVPIRHIYIDMRKSNNANVTPAIAQYLDLYPHEINDVKDIVSYCQNNINQIGAAFAGIHKIRIMSHNVGKFNYGNGGGYSGDDVAQKLLDWKNMYSKLEPDILCGQENVMYFDANQTIIPSNDLFAPLFPNYFGNGTYATFIRSKPNLNSKTDISLSVTVDGTTYTWNASTATIVMNGKNIIVVSTHLSPGYTEDEETARGLQADALIAALSSYDYVIICGDFNSSEETFFNKFKTAGYTCVNHGYWGTIETLPNESVDNIIVKGFVPYNIICNSDDKCTSDHYPVVSDLYLV